MLQDHSGDERLAAYAAERNRLRQRLVALAEADQAGQTAQFFWAMALIAAKQIARSPAADHRPILGFVRQQLATIQAFVGRPGDLEDFLLPLDRLRAMAAAMADLHGDLAGHAVEARPAQNPVYLPAINQ